ncbi:MAG: hypothetical protein JWN27_2898 [Candidatus Eremiobacteraeota bacterium]|nr:hypothetical protein [Candidatus Eremiobacteraeota bacterium]
MAAALSASLVDCAPGNLITLTGTGLTGGPNAGVALQNQGLVTPGPLAIAATFAVDGSSVAFTVPDGATSNTLIVTANDSSQASCPLIVTSQYQQVSQYLSPIEGTDADVADLGQTFLAELLRDASAFVDEHVGGVGLRLLQVTEDHEFKPPNRTIFKGPRIWPLRGPMSSIPIASLDALTFVTSAGFTTTFNVAGASANVYVNKTAGYFELQPAAVGMAVLLAQSQVVAISANVWKIVYTAGFGWMQTPRSVRKATAIIATELLVYRGILKRGFGGLSRVREGMAQYDRRNEEFAMPKPAADLLRNYCPGIQR